METYRDLMRGTKYGPIIIPGNTLDSTFVRAVEGKVHESIKMPQNRGPLPESDVLLIHKWVAAGAKNN